ncbi:PAS domain S-box protein [Arcobacter arenosus]|nr:PAS domain S-box protein [Arcobacter arenosus]
MKSLPTYNGSIKKRLIFIIMSVTLLTALIGYGSFVYWYMQNQYEQKIELSKTVSLILAQDFAKLILLNDVSAAADISDSLKSFSTLESMVLYKLDKKPILQYSKDGKSLNPESLPEIVLDKLFLDGNILKLYSATMYKNSKLGTVKYEFQVQTLFDVIKKNLSVVIIILSLMFLISYFLTLYFAKKFTNPILNLVKFLEKIELKNSYKKRIQTKEKNEYGILYEEVNQMLQRIEDSHNVLKIAAVTFETQNGITITDKNQKILLVNKAFTKITGYEASEVKGLSPKILQSGLHDKNFYDEMKKSLKEKNIWVGEITNKHKDGTIVNEHLTIQSILDNKGEVIYYVASFLDITLQKEMEFKLKEKESQLIQKSKMAAMGEMLENIAHQWRQPLSVISAAASGVLLKKSLELEIDEKEHIESLEKITNTVQYMSNTINDFRDFFKNDKYVTFFNLKNSYERVLGLIGSKLKSIDIELIENLNDVNISGIENEFIQVLMNIISNAKDALNECENRKLLFVDIFKESSNAVIIIKDNAGGIPKELIDKVFEPYFTTKGNEGTGIGLHMSKDIIDNHMNGNLSVENEKYTFEGTEYIGAKFIIKLPISKK